MLSFLRREPGFYSRTFRLALPLILQNLVTTSLAFVDTFMVGLIGDTELSAVTAANAPVFLVQVIIFGFMSGLTVLASQFWGKGDTDSINRYMGTALYAAVALSSLVAVVLFFFPSQVLLLVTNNTTLIEVGAPYLRIVGISYVFNAISSVYVSMQRSTENPMFGMVVFTISMLLNTFLNFMLIFGKFGAPALGVLGAAIATLASRIVEFLIVLVYALHNRRVPLNFPLLLRPGLSAARTYVKYATPVLANEFLWGLGTTVMTSIMGHMTISADMLAAYAIMGNLDKFTTVSCFGLAGASAVIVGKRIGEGADREEVYQVSWSLLMVGLGLGLVLVVALTIALPTLFIPYLYPLFSLSEVATEAAVTLCILYIFTMPMRSFDIVNITGVLRAGGDVAVASLIDLIPLWFFAVPLTALFGLVLDAPLFLVAIGVYAENFPKLPCGILRLRSRKWIHNLTDSIQ